MSIDLTKMPKLGFGMMRLPQKDEQIDIEHVCRMVDLYLEAGLNYFDTAYVYHGGHGEEAVKEALTKRYPREKFMVATKLPAWALKSEADRDRVFSEQMERTGLDFFDFYLLHSLEDGNIDIYERFNCFDWALQKKAEGKIRQAFRADGGKRLIHPGAGLFAHAGPDRAFGEGGGHKIPHGEGHFPVKLQMLRHIAGAQVRDIQPAAVHMADETGMGKLSEQGTDQGRLAGTVLADQDGELSAVDMHGHILEQDLAAAADADPVQINVA